MNMLTEICENYIEECNYYSGGNEQIYNYCCDHILNVSTEKTRNILIAHFKL